MKLIIAATDFSPVSLNAVQYAADMATCTNSDITLLHVCEMPLPLSEVPVSAIDMDSLAERAGEMLNNIKATLEKSHSTLVVRTEIRIGASVLNEIRDYCTVTSPFAIVIGANTGSGIDRLLLGNTAALLAQELEWPLLVVPANLKFTPIRNVGLASDFEDITDTTPTHELKNLIGEFRAKLHVLHVTKGSGHYDYTAEQAAFTELSGLLKDLHPSYHIVNNGNLDEEISVFAVRNKLDLLIVVPKKHTLVGKLLHRSHTKQVLLHTHFPVMALHA